MLKSLCIPMTPCSPYDVSWVAFETVPPKWIREIVGKIGKGMVLGWSDVGGSFIIANFLSQH